MTRQDAKQLGSALNTIAYGEVMKAAVRDYVKVRRSVLQRCSICSSRERALVRLLRAAVGAHLPRPACDTVFAVSRRS